MQGRAMVGNGRDRERLDAAECKEMDLNAAPRSTVKWRGVGAKMGARRRWKRAFDFPILILILSYTLALSIGTISSNMMYKEMTVRGRTIAYQVGASG
jgi:hypothetical protein